MELSTIQLIAVSILPLIFAITLHEVAHGWVASWFGDQTARLSGRLTLNPAKHIDMVGTVIVPILMIVLGGFIFGWARPVPVDPRNFKHPRRDLAIVALAGPIANILMAIGWVLVIRLGMFSQMMGNDWLGQPLVYMGTAGVQLNIVLAVLNMLPLPPLDGGNILKSLLPPRMAYQFSLIEPYSFFILILLMMTGVLSIIMRPFIMMLISIIWRMVGID